MRCSCVYTGYEDENCYTLQAKIVKASKQHKCGECSCDINKGDKYEVAYIVQDGKILTEKTCLDCLSIRDEFFCEGWWYGSILEYLQEHINGTRGDISESCIADLTPKARERVCEMIERAWE